MTLVCHIHNSSVRCCCYIPATEITCNVVLSLVIAEELRSWSESCIVLCDVPVLPTGGDKEREMDVIGFIDNNACWYQQQQYFWIALLRCVLLLCCCLYSSHVMLCILYVFQLSIVQGMYFVRIDVMCSFNACTYVPTCIFHLCVCLLFMHENMM